MATEYGGYMGKILQIDLTNERVSDYPLTVQQCTETLGGKALAYHILSQHLTGNEQAFSEENPLILSTGPLTGTGAPGSNRFEITSISPKTGFPVSSNCGGNFGVSLKKAGFDALILLGRCKGYRWLEIDETGVRFHDASPLWGLGIKDCISQLDTPAATSLCIGPAGEDLLPCATVVHNGRPIGRAGFGAVLGWKGLKGISVSGNKTIPLQNSEKAMETIRQWNRLIRQHPLTSDPQKISSCYGCPIRCKKQELPPDPILMDLGLDALDAPRYGQWLKEKCGFLPEFPIKDKHGLRRNKLYHAILDHYALSDLAFTHEHYLDYTEALSAMGLCIFTVSTCLSTIDGCGCIDPAGLLQDCTGITIPAEQLLTIGASSRRQQEQVCSRFKLPHI